MWSRFIISLLLVLPGLSVAAAEQTSLEDDLGRSETRVRSAAVPISVGVDAATIATRLDARGYRRVKEKPTEVGSYFFGHERFWIYRRPFRLDGDPRPARLVGLELNSRGEVASTDESPERLLLEPLLLAESLRPDRAVREMIRFDELPEHIWRPVLAAEDARFFEHGGIDGQAIARAAAVNAKRGRSAQGGSTITQQLIKNRDLTPKKTFGRKFSEAFRAMAIEGEYTKQEILEAYLNLIYYGHVDGLAIHGVGTAARVYFGKSAHDLNLAESSMLAAMIQGPNALNPARHPERATSRRNWVLDRLAQEGWADVREIAEAKASPIRLRRKAPRRPPARAFLDAVATEVESKAAGRIDSGRGVVVETTLDPLLQQEAQRVVASHLAQLRKKYRKLRNADLSAALVTLDATSGEVLAWVGGDPNDHEDQFDRVRKARRQPGSAIKPFVLFEAFDRCGSKDPLTAATRISDRSLTIELDNDSWTPDNFDRRHHGIVSIREATRRSYNVPFVRIARHCGYSAVATRFQRAGLELPDELPPSFVLGALEATPLQMVAGYTALFNRGRAFEPLSVRRIEKPGGSKISANDSDTRRVASAETAYLVWDLLRDAVANGTGGNASIAGFDVVGKTGTSNSLRDAWFVGGAGGVVTAVWVGRDGGGSLGLTGSQAAAPLWREFMRAAVPARPAHIVTRPDSIVTRRVDSRSGLLLGERARRGRDEIFRRDALPPRNRVWRRDRATAVIN
jgi:penicillin-binding protein 1B